MPTVTLTYGYDKNGNRISVADNLGVRQDSVYGSRNELLSRTMTGVGVDPTRVEFEYRANGERSKLKRFADATGTTLVGSSTYAYYKNELSKSIIHANAAGATLVRYDYTYDDDGRLTQETHHGDTYQYGYDRTSQLLTVVKDGSLFESFSYDKNGNRITVTGPTAGSYQTGAGNRYITDGTFTYTYDAEGNTKTKTGIASGNVTEYFWDYRNRLVKVTVLNIGGIALQAVDFIYDPQGRRISEAMNGTQALRMISDGENSWIDMDLNGHRSNAYLHGERADELIVVVADESSWLLQDARETVNDAITVASQLLSNRSYSAFGNLLSSDITNANMRFGFAGRESESINSLNYFRARHLDTYIGRFLNADPIGFSGGDTNLTRYTRNSPVDHTDPSGYTALSNFVIATTVGATASGLSEIISQVRTTGKVDLSKVGGAAFLVPQLGICILWGGEALWFVWFDSAVGRDEVGAAVFLQGPAGVVRRQVLVLG